MLRRCEACDVLAAETTCWLCGGPMTTRGIGPTASGHTYQRNAPVQIGGKPIFVPESTSF